jgi:hypothetical protein
MNLYLIIAALVFYGVSVAGAGWGGFGLGVDHQKASNADRDKTMREAVDQASQKVAQAISKIKVINTTIQQEVQRETRTEPVYIDCRHTPDGLRLINAALTGARPDPSGGGKLPSVDPAGR